LKLSDKTKFVISVLNELYPEPEIPLEHENNFTFLVAVMLSAQSTDKKVNQITPKLFAKADTPVLRHILRVRPWPFLEAPRCLNKAFSAPSN